MIKVTIEIGESKYSIEDADLNRVKKFMDFVCNDLDQEEKIFDEFAATDDDPFL